MQIFGERLKELRKAKGITTIELAKQLQTSNSIISLWENNKRVATIDNLYKIARFFDVSADYLIGLED